MNRREPRPPFPRGALVRSLSGRDRGRTLLVLEDRGERVVVADGALRPVRKPKVKNPKHLQLVAAPSPEVERELWRRRPSDEEVRAWLRQQGAPHVPAGAAEIVREGGGGGDGQGGHHRGRRQGD